MKNNTKWIALNGIIGAAYAVITILIAWPVAYSWIQFRFTEILILFAFFNKKYIPGLVIGCFIANFYGPGGMIDAVVGGTATLIVLILISKTKKMWMVPIIAAVINGIIIGFELHYLLDLPVGFFAAVFYVFIGEFFAVAVGIPIFNYMMKNNYLKKMILE